MKFKVITPVAIEPVSLAEARLQLKLTADDDTSLDALITGLCTTAREYAEHYTGRALAPVTLEAALDAFPGAIDLPMPPVSGVTSIKYTDTTGVEQTLPTGQYALSTYGDSRMVFPAYGATWPATQDVQDAVRVQFEAGYAIAPKAVKAAILLIVGHLYENRQEVVVSPGSTMGLQIPMGAMSLLDTIKVYGF